ncbi:MAG: glucose-1-phosphate adenylyltransferase [Holophagales bacterium]|nr:glucose-1-phosphate adenylyltransferase [Holophagales bacterium]
MEDTLAFVMAGGQGERLKPLTDVRAKPAVPFGGIFRIIDFTLSNCVNSGLRRIFVLTQYKSYSLSNHLKTGWNMFSSRLDQFIDEVPAQQQRGSSWYQGTADAIRQNANFLENKRPRLALILSGDHVYKMDYRLLRALHDEKHAGLTVACVRLPAEEAAGNFGVMEVDGEGRIVGFEEKPAEPKTIPGTSDCLASMGIYLFEADCLREALDNDTLDFGKDVIPMLIRQGTPVFAYDFTQRNAIPEWEFVKADGLRRKELVPRSSDSDYWRDVGTLEQYWLANLDLVQPHPRVNVYGEHFPLFSAPGHFPPAKFVHEMPDRTGVAVNSIVADGVIVSGATVRESVLGSGVYVHSWAMIEKSVLLGGSIRGGILTETSIGRHCRVRNAIIDKNVHLSENTSIGYDRAADERRGLKTVSMTGSSDYIVVVPKDYSL